ARDWRTRKCGERKPERQLPEARNEFSITRLRNSAGANKLANRRRIDPPPATRNPRAQVCGLAGSSLRASRIDDSTGSTSSRPTPLQIAGTSCLDPALRVCVSIPLLDLSDLADGLCRNCSLALRRDLGR